QGKWRISRMNYKEPFNWVRRFQQTTLIVFSFLLLTAVLWVPKQWKAAGQNSVTTVSAASYGATITPGSIAAAFGARLATQTLIAGGTPLPTNLGGTTVRVNGQLAPLFFVSATQVNFAIPGNTPTGTVPIVVTAGDGTVTTGTAQIGDTAPSIFTADTSG